MKLSEIQGEKAIDLLADLIDPASKIFSDKKVQELFSEDSNNNIYESKKCFIKKEIVEIVSILNGEDAVINVFTLPKIVIEIISDEELLTFFSQSLTEKE